jgi:triacylglycerol lipase
MAGGLIPGFTDPMSDAMAALYGLVAGAPGGKESVRAALDQMTTSAMQSFNASYPDVAGIDYFSWAGRSAHAFSTNTQDAACAGAPNPAAIDVIRVELSLPFEATGGEAVANDGLVTVESARWGTFLGCVPADHLDEIGMFFLHGADPISGFDHAVFFGRVASELEARGF